LLEANEDFHLLRTKDHEFIEVTMKIPARARQTNPAGSDECQAESRLPCRVGGLLSEREPIVGKQKISSVDSKEIRNDAVHFAHCRISPRAT
jgi:hypothetical protein